MLDEPLWTMADVARHLSLSVSSVSRLIESRGLPYVPTIGRGKRFIPADVRAWVARNRVECSGEPQSASQSRVHRKAKACPLNGWDGTKRAGNWRGN